MFSLGFVAAAIMAQPSTIGKQSMCVAAAAAPSAWQIVQHNGLAAVRLFLVGAISLGLLSHLMLFGFGLTIGSKVVGGATGMLGWPGSLAAFLPHAAPEVALFAVVAGLSTARSLAALQAQGTFVKRLEILGRFDRQTLILMALLLAANALLESHVTPWVISSILSCK